MSPCISPPRASWMCCLLMACAGPAGAAAAGVASLMARILAEGNDFGLAFPPRVSRKVIGTKAAPARRVTVEEPIYEVEYADVEQLVPETSAGQPTGGFVRKKVRVAVRQKLVGKRSRERLVPDPEGKETIQVPEYGPGGPDVYEASQFGLNGMALCVLARTGHAHHEAAERLVSKLIDGQIREKGAPRGLWGPVCIHYPYFAKLFAMQGQLHQQLEVELPKMLERATPQQQEALAKQGREMRKVYFPFLKAYRAASSQGTRMMDITRHWQADEQTVLPYEGTWPPLVDLETGVTCASGLVAIDALAKVNEKNRRAVRHPESHRRRAREICDAAGSGDQARDGRRPPSHRLPNRRRTRATASARSRTCSSRRRDRVTAARALPSCHDGGAGIEEP